MGVLVVEDDPLAAKLLNIVFAKRKDLRVTFAKSAEEAGTILAKRAIPVPNLVICDHNLPGMSGVEFIKSLRTMPGLARAASVMLSADPDAQTRRSALAAGAQAFIEKSDFCANFERWMGDLLSIASAKAA